MLSMQRKLDFSQGYSFHSFPRIRPIAAALGLGLLYVLAFPLIGLAMLVWMQLRNATVNPLRGIVLGSVTAATGFFVSVIITVYGGFPVWFV